ncbi:MAG: DUF4340 domain-containing protein [Oscillospiraceae bacterium]
MKKTTKYILITLAVLLVLGGAFAVLYFTDPKRTESEETSSSSAAPATSFINKKQEDVTSVTVKNPLSEFTILQTEKPAESAPVESSEASAAENDFAYTIQGYEKYKLKESTLGAAVENACNMISAKDIGTVDDLAKYGLSGKDAGTVTVNFKDGTKETFTVGIEAGETAGRYVLYGDKVYISSVNTVFVTSLYASFENFNYTVADMTDESGQNPYSILNKLSLSGTNFPEPIEITYSEDKAEFRMTSPFNTDCGISAMDELMQKMKTLSATSIVKANATQADLKEYGLDVPFATTAFTINEESHTLSVSEKKVDGARYMIADGDNTLIYTVKAEDVAPWAETTSFKLRNPYVFLPMIVSVNEFTIEAGGKTCTVELARTVNKEKTTETQTIYDYTAKKDGKDIVYEDVTKFYMSMISIAALNTEETPYADTADVKFTFRYYEGNEDVLEYRKTADDRYVALLNGTYSATVRKTSIDEFQTALDAFIAK